MPFRKYTGKIPRSRQLENLSTKNGLRHAIYEGNGSKYIGEWKNNKKEGRGTMLTKSHILYEGEWKNGNPCGFGIVCYPNPNKKTFHLGYKGRFVEGKLNRTGTYHHSDGSYYIGKWKEGKRQGYGIMWYQDGSFYAGDFFNNFRHGLGTYVRPDGKRYDGEWKKGLKHGKGKLLHLNKGQMQLGVWVDDICVFSVIEDIPYRPVAEFFTPYPIQRVVLNDFKNVFHE